MIILEKILEKSKFVIYIPVLVLLIASFIIFVYSSISFFGFFLDTFTKETFISEVVSAIDMFLLGVLCLMTSASLYELYVKELDSKIKLPETLIVKSLDSLKEKLGKVIYLLLLIYFFKYALQYSIKTNIDLVLFSLSILLISLSLFFTKKKRISKK